MHNLFNRSVLEILTSFIYDANVLLDTNCLKNVKRIVVTILRILDRLSFLLIGDNRHYARTWWPKMSNQLFWNLDILKSIPYIIWITLIGSHYPAPSFLGYWTQSLTLLTAYSIFVYKKPVYKKLGLSSPEN